MTIVEKLQSMKTAEGIGLSMYFVQLRDPISDEIDFDKECQIGLLHVADAGEQIG